ncbi:unnamed protein product [marine sediment metagenome]|uniref:Uncharacterized protein n=1 Tax=marine sediment metagenome TaxID=412755 RepID=X1AVQ0_9ZZZZ
MNNYSKFKKVLKPCFSDKFLYLNANYGWIEDLDGYKHLLLHIKGIPHDY